MSFFKKCGKNGAKYAIFRVFRENCSFIFAVQKIVVILHCQTKKNTKMKANFYTESLGNYNTQSFGEVELTTKFINRNFRIKVNGNVNGQKVNKLVGVTGLLELLGNSIEKLIKFVLRAMNSLADKCACKIYGGATVTFYAK